jgi:trans-2,3-dihydro-3-hydroxyanthranilate isomerase
VTAGRDRQEGPGLPYLILDVFAEAPLQGNQLGVFTDAVGVGSEQMQRLARELNFSETAFLFPPEQDGDARVRIFTPDHELPFAGHPVLGSAVAVAAGTGSSGVRLETGLGLIPVALRWQSELSAFGRMQQRVPSWSPYEHEAELLTALGITRSGLPVEAYPNGPLHVYVELEGEGAVAELRPDMRALAELEACANCFAGHGKSWETRMFAAAYGVNEDPATGSAAGPLAVHLARHGRTAFGEEIEIRQGIEIGRPSVLYARAEGSSERVERVEVGGSAVIVARGEFLIR